MNGCDQCNMLSINGHACHEHGCPNSGKRFDPERDEWVAQRRCFVCGYARDADSACCESGDL